MKGNSLVAVSLALLVLACAAQSSAQNARYTWRYYRPVNTGVHGDKIDAVWIDSSGNPWIAGYDPSF